MPAGFQGYQSFAEYYEDLDAVVIEFYSTTDPKLYNWNLSEIVNSRIVKILRKPKEFVTLLTAFSVSTAASSLIHTPPLQKFKQCCHIWLCYTD